MTDTRQPPIVAGLDLSSASRNALLFAGRLCHSVGGKLIVVHCVTSEHTDSGSPGDGGFLLGQTSLEEDIRKESPGLPIQWIIEQGDPVEVLLAVCSEYAADCAVVGSTGSGNNNIAFVGNTTGGLIKLGSVPVLVIPSHCQYTPMKEILFAVKDPHVASRQVIAPFMSLRDHFAARTTLLHVTKDSMPDLSRFHDPYLITPHVDKVVESESDNIYLSVESFIEGNQTDLLVVINRLRGFFEGLFAQGASVSFRSPLPILVLHGGSRDPFI